MVKDKTNIWAKGQETGRYYRICESTGDNLLQEDVDEGYVDYIYYEIYEDLNHIHENEEYDGGMYLLKKYYQDMTVEEIVDNVASMEEPLIVLE